MKKLFVLFILVVVVVPALCQEVWTIGPMVHINFGGDKRRTSFGIETAYWHLQNFYYSIDGGIEFESKRFRIYSEMQTGIGLAGISAGPVFELNQEGKKAHLGFQTTAWVNYLLGVDYRMRWINHNHYNAIGFYGKVPIATSGLSDNKNGLHNSHDHIWHWD